MVISLEVRNEYPSGEMEDPHADLDLTERSIFFFCSVCVISVNKYVVSIAMIASGLLDEWIDDIVDQLIF